MTDNIDPLAENCSICLSLVGSDEKYVPSVGKTDRDHRASRTTVLHCGHVYCKLCIGDWITREPSCPMCKQSLTFKDQVRIFGPLRALKGPATTMALVAIEVAYLVMITLTIILSLIPYQGAKRMDELVVRSPLLYPVFAPVGLLFRVSLLFFVALYSGEEVLFKGCVSLLGRQKSPIWGTPGQDYVAAYEETIGGMIRRAARRRQGADGADESPQEANVNPATDV